MRREQRLAMLLEVCFIGVHHSVKPWQKFLCAVVGVQNDWDAVGGSNTSDVVSCGDSAGDRGLLLIVLDTLYRSSVHTLFAE